MNLETQSLQTRLMLLIGAAVVSMIALSAILIVESRTRIQDFHIENAKTALSASLSILEEERRQIAADDIKLKEMQAEALAKLRKFRYHNGEGYVAVLDDTGFVIMHPIHDHLENTNIWDFQDPNGSFIAREAIATARREGVGVRRYLFEHPITGKQDIKTSAVGRFDPWGWTLVVGVFDSNVASAVNNMFKQAALAVLAMSALFLVLAMIIGRSLARPIARMTDAMTAIADGKLDTPIPYQNYQNENGRMSRALTVFRNSSKRILDLQAEREKTQKIAEQQRLEMTTSLRKEFGDVLEAASNGRFCSRVSTDVADENLRNLAEILNAFVEKVDAGVSAVKNGMARMSTGKQPRVRADDFDGAFAEMLQQVTTTSLTIRNQAEILRHRAYNDTLTKLPNRRHFKEKLKKLQEESNHKTYVALLHIDLDRLKQINDTLGHSAGDEILKYTAKSLKSVARECDFIARIGGDEFVVLCTQDLSEEVVNTIANSIVDKLAQPLPVTGGIARFGASVGVAFGQKKLTSLFQDSDLALYHAKRSGRNQVAYFTEHLRTEFVKTKQISDDISRGLENNEFIPYFQPQFDAHTLEIVGVEALARWKKSDGNIIPPGYFLAVAEEFNLLSKIDNQISLAALEVINRINNSGQGFIPKLSLNISSERLMDSDFINSLDVLEHSEFKVSFELLESIMFDDQDEQFLSQIDTLRERGFDIEIDDFGSGRASITGLLKVSPKRLKIDRALIAPIVDRPVTRRLVETIIEMGRTLQIDVVAEGVETSEHIKLLRDMHCQTLQGYALAKPMSEEELIKLLGSDDLMVANY